MKQRIENIDLQALEHDGYTVLRELVRKEELDRFEHTMTRVAETLVARRGIARRSTEALTDLLQNAGIDRGPLFDHIKRLSVIQYLGVDITRSLEEADMFKFMPMEAPVTWTTLRADLPGEHTYTFPLHQDYKTTRSDAAWRLWIPLRPVDRVLGTMAVYPGSHRRGPYKYVTRDTTYPHIEESRIRNTGIDPVSLELGAGDGVLFSPWLVHGSVPNRSDRIKFVMLLHIQDLTRFGNPEDPDDPLAQFFELTRISEANSEADG